MWLSIGNDAQIIASIFYQNLWQNLEKVFEMIEIRKMELNDIQV